MSIRTILRAATRFLAPGLLAAVLALPGASIAQSSVNLDQAKQRGMVCELPTGYLKSTGNATPDVTTMVNDINNKRKQEYARIADEHGVTPEQVGKLTAQKLSPKCQ